MRSNGNLHIPIVVAVIGFAVIMGSYHLGFSSAERAATTTSYSDTGQRMITYTGIDKEFALMEVQKWRIIGSIIMACGLFNICSARVIRRS